MDVKMALRRWKRDERDKCRLVLFLFSLGGVQKPHAATTTSGAIAGQTLHHRTRLPFWVTAGADIVLDAANDDQQRESDLIVRQSVRRSTSHGSPPDVDIHNMAGIIGALDSLLASAVALIPYRVALFDLTQPALDEPRGKFEHAQK